MTGALSDALGSFAELVAAPTPTPGGGSVAAYAGALAAALGQMVCNLTIGKKKYAEVEPRIKEIRAELERAGARLKELISEDAASFDSVMAAYRLPKETEAEKAERDRQIDLGARRAAEVPHETARRSLEVLTLVGELKSIANPNTFSDMAVAGQLAQAAVKGGCYNVGVNLQMIADRELAASLGEQISRLIADAKARADELESEMMIRI